MSSRNVARVIFIGVGIAASIWFVYLIREVIGLVFIAVFLAIALAPAVGRLNRKMPRGVAIAITYFALILAIFGVGLLLVPPVVTGVEDLSKDAPGYIRDLRDDETLRKYDDKYKITQKLEDQAAKLPSKLGDAAGALQDVTVGVFAALVKLITVLVMAAFLLADGGRFLKWVEGQLDPLRKRRFQRLSHDIYHAVGGYVLGNFLISFLAGMMTWGVLELLDVPFAVPLGLLVAFLDLIPLVGATIGGVIVGVVCAATDFPTALIVWAVVLIVYQQLENHLLQPFIYGKSVKLHPLLVIIAILVGAALLGVLGALVAIPVAASIQILVRDWWEVRQQRLGPLEDSPAL